MPSRKTCRKCGERLARMEDRMLGECYISDLCYLRAALRRTRKALRIAKRALQFLANDGQGWAPGAKEALADIRRAERGK